MSFFKQCYRLFLFRFSILLKQKLLQFSLLLGIVILPIVYSFAIVTYSHSKKIYWDLALGAYFVIQILLSSYLGSHLFSEEKENRGLYTLLSVGIRPKEWIWGNLCGLGTFFLIVNLIWWTMASLFSYWMVGQWADLISLQAQLLLSFEVYIVLAMSFFFSFFMRPLFSWFLSMAMILVLHSLSFLEQNLHFSQEASTQGLNFYKYLFLIFKFLPPLDWFNLRDFVAYQESYSWAYVGSALFLSFLWVVFWQIASEIKIDKMDL